jgi:hypothetical protein
VKLTSFPYALLHDACFTIYSMTHSLHGNRELNVLTRLLLLLLLLLLTR